MTVPISQPEALLQAVLGALADKHDLPLTIKQVNLLAAAAARTLNPLITAEPPRSPLGRQLTPQETSTLIGLANGLSYEDMGRIAGRSTETIRSRAVNLYRRLGVHTAAHAVAIALSTGDLDPRMVGPLATCVTSGAVA